MNIARLLCGVVAAGALLAPGCSSSGDGSITVFAASSLTGAFGEMAEAFTAETGSDVHVEFAGSSVLATQIAEGAAADVFASANEAVMENVSETDNPVHFASNRLFVAVRADTEYQRTPLENLVDGGALMAVCAPSVPCGTHAEDLLAKAGVTDARVTREADVKAVVAKIELGEVDAGVVYESDIVAGSGGLKGVLLSGDIVNYPIATIRGAGTIADGFVSFVLSDPGQAILRSHGFGPPT